MCGRYALYGPKARSRIEREDESARERSLIETFVERYLESFTARFNIAPQQGSPEKYVPIVRESANGAPEIVTAQWWLLPHWSKERRIRFTTFNARTETVATAASFRVPFRRSRCLIPASGWYEWQELATGNLPWFIRVTGGTTAMLAGLWDRWEQNGEVVESCAIVIGEANDTIRRFHDRMPFPIPAGRQAAWIDRSITDVAAVHDLLQPVPPGDIQCHRVSRQVNNARNEGEELSLPIDGDN